VIGNLVERRTRMVRLLHLSATPQLLCTALSPT